MTSTKPTAMSAMPPIVTNDTPPPPLDGDGIFTPAYTTGEKNGVSRCFGSFVDSLTKFPFASRCTTVTGNAPFLVAVTLTVNDGHVMGANGPPRNWSVWPLRVTVQPAGGAGLPSTRTSAGSVRSTSG